MAEWNYTRDESAGDFKPIPAGDYRIRIASAEKVVSKTGKDMLSLKFDVSGQPGYLFHNIVFLPDRPEITNRNLTKFFDSFKDIAEGKFEMSTWIGKIGACRIKHEEYNGKVRARVDYFIHKDKQGGLPAWVEPERKSEGGSTTTDDQGFLNVSGSNIDEVVPF